MRFALTRLGAAAAVAVLTGCSGADAPKRPEGLPPAEVCGGFAKGTPAGAALVAAMGSDRFTDGLSEPEKALALLRDATAAPLADTYRPQPKSYCTLLPVSGGGDSLTVNVNPIGKAPGMHPGLLSKATLYTSGRLAYASAGLGRLYFSCGLEEPAHGFVVEVAVSGPGGVPDADLRQRTRLITVANAAARSVAGELGCADTGLVDGAPAEARS
ncbi:hypothetical protein ACFY8C_05675 [Streptomyces flavochromogenes]|uniref:DUF3558 domain-containing protein n=1 Tax=Streptomyces flavochromogenes TaxID=68199 RepID=A0ABW6XK62_9ACTN|nr:hypothetical protein [Streptomyces flavochromogenes]